MKEDISSWNDFKFEALISGCWWCGLRMRPSGWNAPWLIERAHIVNSPRRKDRRVAALLCSRCHRLQHGERLVVPNTVPLVPTTPHLVWLKKHCDPEYFDLEYMSRNSLTRLSVAKPPDDRVWEIPIERWSDWIAAYPSKIFTNIKELRREATKFAGFPR